LLLLSKTGAPPQLSGAGKIDDVLDPARKPLGVLALPGGEQLSGRRLHGFDGGINKRQPARSNYAAALISTGATLAMIEAAEGDSIGRASILLAVAGVERPTPALFAAF
jgi:hypothetical protein